MLTYEKKIALEKQVGFFQIELATLKTKLLEAIQQKDREAQKEIEHQMWEVSEALIPLERELNNIEIEFPHLAQTA